jgi:acetyl-CoA decarbonylase/synthase complex subunit delta
VSKNTIREINFQGVKIGGETQFRISPIFALEINVFNYAESSHIVQDYFEEKSDLKKIISEAQDVPCDILALKFNVSDEDNLSADVERSKQVLKRLLPDITKPLMIIGAGNKAIDVKLLPQLISVLDRECIISYIEENTYKEILPSIIKGGHIAVIRTPIDINLAKEMNILSTDMGLSPDKIIMDTDMGGLGYGLEYGYSIIERIKLAAFDGDDMLNMPLVAFVGEEALKTKETKSDTFAKSYGDFKLRSKMFEITTASAVVSTGANLIVLECPESIEVLKKTVV